MGFFYFPLFSLSSTNAAAGPLDITAPPARAMVKVLGFVSLVVAMLGSWGLRTWLVVEATRV